MTIRKKTLFAIGGITLGLISLFYAISSYVILQNFDRLEQGFVTDNIRRVKATIADQIIALDTLTHDWASWDDTYNFINDTNQAFIASNIVEDTFTTSAEINLLLFFDTDKKLVHGTVYDPETEEMQPPPQGIITRLQEQITLFTFPKANELDQQGLLRLPDGIVTLAARPILKSSGEGPSRGTLIMGRYLTHDLLRKVAEITRTSFTVHETNTPSSSKNIIEALSVLSQERHDFYVTPVDDSVINGYTLLQDVNHAPFLFVELTASRDIHTQGHKTQIILVIALLAASLVFASVIFLMLDYLVLKRVAALSREVASIGDHASPDSRVTEQGSDELADLASSINDMLISIANTQQELKENEMRVRTIAEFTRSGFFITQGENLIYVNSVMEEFTGYSKEQLLKMNWWDIFHSENKNILRDTIMQVQKVAVKPQQFSVRLITAEGKEQWIDLRIKQVSFQGKPAGFAVCTDT
jgi:PAS domain S-box-containing protein